MNTRCCEFDGLQKTQSQVTKNDLLSQIKTHSLKWIAQLRIRRENRIQRRIDRDAFLRLMVLDDAMLKDIGVKREDVIWASQLPLSVNASLELEKIARQPSRR